MSPPDQVELFARTIIGFKRKHPSMELGNALASSHTPCAWKNISRESLLELFGAFTRHDSLAPSTQYQIARDCDVVTSELFDEMYPNFPITLDAMLQAGKIPQELFNTKYIGTPLSRRRLDINGKYINRLTVNVEYFCNPEFDAEHYLAAVKLFRVVPNPNIDIRVISNAVRRLRDQYIKMTKFDRRAIDKTPEALKRQTVAFQAMIASGVTGGMDYENFIEVINIACEFLPDILTVEFLLKLHPDFAARLIDRQWYQFGKQIDIGISGVLAIFNHLRGSHGAVRFINGILCRDKKIALTPEELDSLNICNEILDEIATTNQETVDGGPTLIYMAKIDHQKPPTEYCSIARLMKLDLFASNYDDWMEYFCSENSITIEDAKIVSELTGIITFDPPSKVFLLLQECGVWDKIKTVSISACSNCLVQGRGDEIKSALGMVGELALMEDTARYVTLDFIRKLVSPPEYHNRTCAIIPSHVALSFHWNVAPDLIREVRANDCELMQELLGAESMEEERATIGYQTALCVYGPVRVASILHLYSILRPILSSKSSAKINWEEILGEIYLRDHVEDINREIAMNTFLCVNNRMCLDFSPDLAQDIFGYLRNYNSISNIELCKIGLSQETIDPTEFTRYHFEYLRNATRGAA